MVIPHPGPLGGRALFTGPSPVLWVTSCPAVGKCRIGPLIAQMKVMVTARWAVGKVSELLQSRLPNQAGP